jgi:hypothetical protein
MEQQVSRHKEDSEATVLFQDRTQVPDRHSFHLRRRAALKRTIFADATPFDIPRQSPAVPLKRVSRSTRATGTLPIRIQFLAGACSCLLQGWDNVRSWVPVISRTPRIRIRRLAIEIHGSMVRRACREDNGWQRDLQETQACKACYNGK